jgi:hypothetical protein
MGATRTRVTAMFGFKPKMRLSLSREDDCLLLSNKSAYINLIVQNKFVQQVGEAG